MRLVLFLALSLLALPAWATTYYVRPDGGTAAQCLGTTDAAYDGSGSDEACAFKNLTYALGINGGAAAEIAGGDTVIVKNGSYPIGYHVDHPISGCTSGSASTCYMRPPPNGPSASVRTRILGEQSEAGCRVRPELWGTRGVLRIINVQGASNVELACLEITDHSNCVSKHYDPAKLCSGTGDYGYEGFRGELATNWVLRDINVHGMPNFAMHVAALTDWDTTRLRLHANGYGGWNGSISGGAPDTNAGTITFRQFEFSFNGCTENYPSLAIHACIGQNGDNHDGAGDDMTPGSDGYGDGIGTGNTGGNWIFEDGLVHHNTQDGIDMLYLNQPGGTMIARRVKSWANAGNQMKLSGLVTIESSLIVGFCNYFATPTERYYPAMTIASGDSCRASGNPLVLRPAKATGTAATVRYSTITGNGDQLVNISPGYLGADAGTYVRFENNVMYGHPQYNDPTVSGLLYITLEPDVTIKPTIQWFNNHVRNVSKTSSVEACPTGSYCAAAPGLKDLALPTFDARPTAGSNVLGQGTNCGGSCTIPATDLKGKARPAAPARGALEL